MDLIPRYNGVVRGIVKDNNDPQNLRRVRVSVPQITGNEVTGWLWPMISTQRPPSIGQGVWINYISGDPEYPVWIGEFAKKEVNPAHASNGPFFQGIFSHGSFFSTATQSPTAENTPKAITLNQTDISEGVSIKNNSQFHVDYGAMYNLQFSLQLHHITGGGGGSSADVWIWLKKNGVNVPSSATRVVVSTGHYQVAAWNFLIHLNNNEYAELFWSTGTVDMRIQAESGASGVPDIPSVIATLTQVA